MEGMRALIVGIGGLGCPSSLALAAAGIEHLTLIDPDVVELSNLHRQPWHTDADLGRPKVDSAAEKLRQRFPNTTVATSQLALTAQNAASLIAGHDVVLDGTDRGPVKFLLSDLGRPANVAVIFGGVLKLEGLAMRIEPKGPCLRCLFEESALDGPTCAQVGVLGPMAGWVGATQAALALHGTPGVLHRFDGEQLRRREVTVNIAPDCPRCSS